MTQPTLAIRPLLKTAAAALGLVLLPGAVRADRPYAAWLQEYDRTFSRSQFASAVAMDARGNVFVAGVAKDINDVNRFYTAKYDALDGHLVWEQFEQSGSTIFDAKAIAVDSAGNVVVTGSRNASGSIDYYTVKYNGATGARVWAAAKTYDGTAGGQDVAYKVATLSNNDVIVAGISRGNNNSGNPSGDDIVTLKYASATGNLLATDIYTTASSRDEKLGALVVDSQDNVIIAGTANTASGVFRFYVRKLNSSLAKVWDTATPIDTGGDGGATGVAVDSSNNVVATGLYRDASSHLGFFTAKFAAANGAELWRTNNPPLSSSIFNPRPAPTVAIGPDNNPVVTGQLNDGSGNLFIRTIKYTSAGFFGGESVLWTKDDTGLGFGDSLTRAIVVDGASNAIVIGESDNKNLNTDIYVAKYDASSGERVYAATFGGDFGTDDTGVGVAVDGNGGFATVGTAFRNFNGTGRTEIVTIKFNRFLAFSGDDLPDDPGVPVNAKYTSGGAPAVADTGAVAARITMAAGATKLGAIFTQGVAGGTSLPAVQNGTVPGLTGAKFASFSDPIVAPNGQYAFAAKLSGVVESKANGVWTNLGGTLHLALQQGTPVPGMTENLVKVMSLSLSSTRLVALVKVAASTTSNVALVSIDKDNNGTVIRRTGDTVMADGVQSTVKKITALSPAKASPGDGRWHRGTVTTYLMTLADNRTVLIHPNSGILELVTNGPNFNPKSFGLPALSSNALRFTTLLTRNVGGSVTTANDSLIIRYGPGGTMFEQVAVEGDHPNNAGLSTLTFAGFADPLVDILNNVLFLATLKGGGVTTANNKALLFGVTHAKVARTGDPAPDSAGVLGTAKWSAFVAHTLCGTSPVFVAKLAGTGVTAKNNLGIWGVDSAGFVRRLLRTGDVLGTQTVKSFTLLKAVPTAFSAARSANANGSIAALIVFTDGRQALVTIGIP